MIWQKSEFPNVASGKLGKAILEFMTGNRKNDWLTGTNTLSLSDYETETTTCKENIVIQCILNNST